MEKKNVIFDSSGNSVTMRYELTSTDVLDDTALGRLNGNLIEMTAPIYYREDGSTRAVYSQIPRTVQLSSFLKKVLSKGEALTIIKNLATGMDIGKHSIPVSYIIKDADCVYIDEQTLETYVYIIPIKNQNMDVSELPGFFRSVISHMRFREEDKDNYVARLLTKVNSDRFSLSDFMVLVTELLVEVGDAQLAGVSRPGAKVDKVGVMRNRAGQMPQQPMGGPIPPMGQPMAPQQPMGQPMAPQQPMGQPMPQQPVQRFDPMTGKPMGQPQAPEAPKAPVPPMGQPMPQQPVQRFDPMTGKPMGQPQRRCRKHQKHRRHQCHQWVSRCHSSLYRDLIR